jgi:SAM-dependent methyltransferase
MIETKAFNRSGVSQESQYAMPYHYIPSFEGGHFSQHLYWSWGYHYLGALEYLIGILNEERFESLIDVGCGDGRLLRDIGREFSPKKLLGVDYSKRAIDLARALNPGLDYMHADICSDESQLKSFDVVTLVEVLEHIPLDSVSDFVSAFAGLNRPGGRLLLTVPHKNKQLQEKHFQHFDSVTLRKTLEPYYEIERLIYFDRLSRFLRHGIYPFLENRLFILNNRFLLDLFFSMYRKYFFLCCEEKCGRLCVIGRRKR